MEEDLASMMALVGKCIAKKSYRAQLGAFDVPGALRFGKKFPHGLTGVDQRLPQCCPGSRSPWDFLEAPCQGGGTAFEPIETRHVHVNKIAGHRLTPREDLAASCSSVRASSSRRLTRLLMCQVSSQTALKGSGVFRRPPEIR